MFRFYRIIANAYLQVSKLNVCPSVVKHQPPVEVCEMNKEPPAGMWQDFHSMRKWEVGKCHVERTPLSACHSTYKGRVHSSEHRGEFCASRLRGLCAPISQAAETETYPSSGLQLWFLCVSQTCIRLCCYKKLPVVRLGTEWHEDGGMIHLLRVTAKGIFENLQSERITLLLIA